MRLSNALASAALVAGVSAAEKYLGFNSGALQTDGKAKQESDFLAEFKNAQKLKNAPGVFNSVRLYTNIQGGTENDPISAFKAAAATNTSVLLGIWTSGTDSIQNEIDALLKGVEQNKDLKIVGISIGSEDLYRAGATGIANKAGLGTGPDALLKFIQDYRKQVKDHPILKSVPVGHVDTWDAFTNGTNKPVIDECEFLGVDEYPFYEVGKNNSIENSYNRFTDALNKAKDAIGDKELWVTETGWPIKGKTWDKAVPSRENAKFYWDNIGCQLLFGKVNTFWYTQHDSNGANDVKFGLADDLTPNTAYDLTCPDTFAVGPSTNSGSGSGSNSTSSSSDSGSGTASGSGSGASATNVSPGSSGSPTGSSSAATSSKANAGAHNAHMLPAVFYAGMALIAAAAALM